MNESQLKALELLEDDYKISEVVNMTGLSINIVKNISRLKNMYAELYKMNLDKIYIDKFRNMNFKAFELADVIKEKDNDLLIEVISSTVDAKKKDIKNIIQDIRNKRDKVEGLKNEALYKKSNLNAIEEMYKKELDKFNKTVNKEEYELFGKCTENEKEFFRSHIKKKDDEYVLAKKLSPDIQKEMKQKKIIRLKGYVWYISDIKAFLGKYRELRSERIGVAWKDSYIFREETFFRGHYTTKIVESYHDGYKTVYREDDAYKIDEKLPELDIWSQLDDLKNAKKKRTDARAQLKKVKSQDAENYKQNTLVSNTLAVNEIENHRLIQDLILKKYYTEGNVAVPEVPKDNYRFDCFVFNFCKDIDIVEVKASRADFIQDKKYTSYKSFCNRLFFALDSNIRLKDEELNRLKEEGIGLYKVNLDDNSIVKVLDAKYVKINEDVKEELIEKSKKILRDKVQNGF